VIQLFAFLSLLFLFGSCTSVNEDDAKNSVHNSPHESITFSNSKISLDCQGDHCSHWKKWLEEIIKKSPKHKITKAFYKKVDKKFFRARNFADLINQLDGLVVSYADYHCLDGQISCTFINEKKIYFNKLSQNLNKADWIRIFWHEIFHLVYPEIHHISCLKCSGKVKRKYAECDESTFSSYGLERFWVAAHAKKYFTDKTFKQQNKVLRELENRICR
jgi:hypothetical protein